MSRRSAHWRSTHRVCASVWHFGAVTIPARGALNCHHPAVLAARLESAECGSSPAHSPPVAAGPRADGSRGSCRRRRAGYRRVPAPVGQPVPGARHGPPLRPGCCSGTPASPEGTGRGSRRSGCRRLRTSLVVLSPGVMSRFGASTQRTTLLTREGGRLREVEFRFVRRGRAESVALYSAVCIAKRDTLATSLSRLRANGRAARLSAFRPD